MEEHDQHFQEEEDIQPVVWTREDMLDSLKLASSDRLMDDLIIGGYLPPHPLIAIDMRGKLITQGDTVKVYRKIDALVVVVTKTRDLILEIDDRWYYCFAGNVKVERDPNAQCC